MFAHEGLLEPLSEALLHVSHDDDDLAENAKGRIVHIFLLFSQADMKVKEIMLTRAIILRKLLFFLFFEEGEGGSSSEFNLHTQTEILTYG
jgi:hypothetical protein